jgi:uncharacterized membrane protein YfhO
VLEARLQRRGLVVLNQALWPGWRARVDGAERAPCRVDALMQGVRVDAGEHEVIFEYAPASFRWGAALSGLGLLLGVGALARRPAA